MRYLFTGPSLPDIDGFPVDDDVRVLPPIAADDLLRLPLAEGDVVGIIDGYFHQVGAVRHKEIFAALAKGVRVLGASSMGALRAAEMNRYGMEGVGHVYAEYRDGHIDGDDEVALLHGPAEAGYPAFSQPLVNLRATLAAAEDKALIGEDERQRLIDRLAMMPYPRRTYPILTQIAEELGLPQSKVGALGAFCREHAVDVKRSDALLLLDRMTEATASTGPRPRLSRTWLLHNWELDARGASAGKDGPWVSDISRLRVCQLFAHDYVDFHRELVFGLVARECAQECPAYVEDRPRIQTVIKHGRHRGFYPDELDERDFGFLAQWTTEAERTGRSPEEVLPTFLTRSFRVQPGGEPIEKAIESLTGTEGFEQAAGVARAAAQMEAKVRAAGHDSADLSPGRMIKWFAKRWRVEPEDVEFAALDRGLTSLEMLLEAAQPYYLVAKYNPSVVDFAVRARRDSAVSPAS